MPDFGGYVREHLPPLEVAGAREAEIIEELALELEEHYLRELRNGLTPDSAWDRVTARGPQWPELGRDLRGALPRAAESREKMPMNSGNNIRFAFRMLRRSPAFMVGAVLVIALGIGPNTAMFSAIYSIFLAPAPWSGKGEMVVLWSRSQGHGMIRGTVDGMDRTRVHVSARDFEEWKRQGKSFQGFAAARQKTVTLNDESRQPERIPIESYTPGYLTMLGYRMQLGRDFLPEEGINGNRHVAILSNRLWRQRFGADPHIPGKRIRLDGEAFSVVGVTAPGEIDNRAEPLWTALTARQDDAGQDDRILTVLAQLKPGVTIAQAQAEMDAIAGRLAGQYPKSDSGWAVRVEPYRNDWLNPRARANLWLLMGAVTLVLLISCVNVANLLLARGGAREKEMTIRTSLGATRGQLIRQLLTESLVLFALGGAAGVAMSWGILRTFLALLPKYAAPTYAPVSLSVPALLFAMAITLMAGVAFGCAPARRMSRADAGRMRFRNRFAKSLVVAEFALTLMLLAAAGLVLRTFWDRTHLDLGIRTDHVVTFEVPVTRDRFPASASIEPFYRELIGRIGAIPGVMGASAVSVGLLDEAGVLPFTIVGRPANPPQMAGFRVATDGFVETFGVRMARGRAFTSRDRPESELVAMVNERFVAQYLNGRDPLVESLTLPVQLPAGRRRIVGVFHDIQNSAQIGREDLPEVYVPFAQVPLRFMALAVRTGGDPAGMTRAIAAAVHSVDPEMPLANVRTAAQIVGERLGFDRFEALVYGTFAGLALVLACAGIYGVMAFIVSQRTREVGVRIALGAERWAIMRLVLGEGLVLAGAGLLVGLGCAWWVGRVVAAALYAAKVAGEAGTAVVVGAVLLGCGALACAIPARRAAGVDPMVALRDE